MRINRWWVLVSFVVLGAAACGPASTPVTPAPASATELAQIKQRLPGTWVTKQLAKAGKPPEDLNEDIVFTYTPDGKFNMHIGTPFGSVDKDYSYTLDGKNITSDSPYSSLRIDELTDTTAKFFYYERSETYYVVKK
jgi:hypothetical protein